jgi:hypothetical protein
LKSIVPQLATRPAATATRKTTLGFIDSPPRYATIHLNSTDGMHILFSCKEGNYYEI